MGTRSFSVAIIGAGAIAESAHIPGYQRLADVSIAAVMDVNIDRAQRMADKFGIGRATDRIEDIVADSAIDAVSVCSPNRFHAEQAIAALRGGKHVLCEKPMALTVADAEAIANAAQESGKRLMVGFTHRFLRANQWIKKQLDDGVIGQLYSIRARYAHNGPYESWGAVSGWFFDPELAGGGALLDMGIHAIDLMRFFAGEVARVDGRIHTYKHSIPVEDYAFGLLDFENGCTGYLEVGWMSMPGFTGVELYGSKGTIINDYQTVRVYREIDGQPSFVQPLGIGGGGWDLEVEHFVKLARGDEGVEAAVSVRDGIESLRIALELYKGARA